ncbi:MAG: agmatine deiminase family protein [Candidatus Eisenbacteria sp.]|nr:agmatine deiminase family protein [Candidatus Eisenbacteria bacterium]
MDRPTRRGWVFPITMPPATKAQRRTQEADVLNAGRYLAVLVMAHMLACALVGPARGGPSAPTPDVGQAGPQSKPPVILPRDFDARFLHRDEPPVQAPRNVAEFERMQGVLIRYPLGIPYGLIAEMSVADTVFTLVANQAEEDQAAAQYASHGVNMSNARFIHALTDGIYTRDYGPWYILDGNGDAAIVNHTYEAWQSRPHDDQIPHAIGEHFGIPVYDLGLIHVGGNYQSDGHGTTIITRKVYDWNTGFTESEIDSIMEVFLGIDRNICLPYFEPEGLHHIDCWAKLLSPEKIVIKRVPESDPNYERVERNVSIIGSLENCFGRPYEIYRVDEVGSENYTNSLILNGKVYVPQFESPNDAPALAMFEAALPGYEVHGFGNWWWYSMDALHCRTKEMSDLEMLYVDHAPLLDTDQTAGSYRVDVLIQDGSHAGLIADSLSLFWCHGQAPLEYSELPLFPGSGVDSFYAEIPGHPLGTPIAYYLRASSYSGKSETHPMIRAAEHPHRFWVRIDEQPPTINHDPIGNITLAAWPPTVEAVIKDNVGVTTAAVQWWIDGTAQASLCMTKLDGYLIYESTFEGSVNEGTVIEYRIIAGDGTNLTYDPPSGRYRIEIISPLPLLVWNPDPTPSSGETMHQMLEELEVPHEYTSDYEMPVLINYDRVFIFLGIYENNRVLSLGEAESLAGYLTSGGDVYMEGGDCWAYDPHCGVYLSLFGISAAEDGSHDLHSLDGIAGTLGDAMAFTYSGENMWMDELWATPDASGFFLNPADGQLHAVSFESERRRTIACSFEFGGLDDGPDPSTKGELLSRYADFFDLPSATGVPGVPGETGIPSTLVLKWRGSNPLIGSGLISFGLPGQCAASIRIYGVDGRLVRTLRAGIMPAGWHAVRWDGCDEGGVRVSPGVYFCRLRAADKGTSTKIVCLK